VRIDTRPRKRNAPRPLEKSAPGYLQWLRGRNCIVGSAACLGKIEAAHVDHAGDKGMGTKVSDRYAIPLCSHHHRMQHTYGWPEFERNYIPLGAINAASRYWDKWPGRIAWERKLEERS
jgi:hypothetical protein